jgi:hypothetical protein
MFKTIRVATISALSCLLVLIPALNDLQNKNDILHDEYMILEVEYMILEVEYTQSLEDNKKLISNLRKDVLVRERVLLQYVQACVEGDMVQIDSNSYRCYKIQDM